MLLKIRYYLLRLTAVGLAKGEIEHLAELRRLAYLSMED
jgi:hypothetical protein